MNITIIIPSRGRVRGLSAVLTSLRILESGKHNVQYVVGCDEDDLPTINLCAMIQKDMPDNFSFNVGPRPKTLGGLVNELAEAVPGDVYTALCDDTICTTPYWDIHLADAVTVKPYGVFFWRNAFASVALWGIVTEAWRVAAGGIFSGDYPFWFDDLALLEQWVMATDEEPLGINICMADKPENTMRMRELPFWCGVFNKTRSLRLARSNGIAKKLGLPKPKKNKEFAAFIEEMVKSRMSPEVMAQIEKQGDLGEPDESYLAAKADAEKMLEALAA